MFILYIISSPVTGRTHLYYLCEVALEIIIQNKIAHVADCWEYPRSLWHFALANGLIGHNYVTVTILDHFTNVTFREVYSIGTVCPTEMIIC